jgi:hypothetical protein
MVMGQSVEIVSTERPAVAARFARALSMCIARRLSRQLSELLQVEEAISFAQDST